MDERQDEKWMQNVAREMNLSETAFLVQENDGFNLRWFTPTTEDILCGHATLASAHILWEKGYLPKEQEAKFYTKSGVLTAKLAGGWIDMNFPATVEKETEPPVDLLNALDVDPIYVGKSSIFDYIVEVKSEEIIRNIKPDLALLSEVPMRGVIVTAKSAKYDYVTGIRLPRESVSTMAKRIAKIKNKEIHESLRLDFRKSP